MKDANNDSHEKHLPGVYVLICVRCWTRAMKRGKNVIAEQIKKYGRHMCKGTSGEEDVDSMEWSVKESSTRGFQFWGGFVWIFDSLLHHGVDCFNEEVQGRVDVVFPFLREDYAIRFITVEEHQSRAGGLVDIKLCRIRDVGAEFYAFSAVRYTGDLGDMGSGDGAEVVMEAIIEHTVEVNLAHENYHPGGDSERVHDAGFGSLTPQN